MPARKSKPSAAPAADGHDLIRVHGARVNNLKDISVEIPKRRLTVFTGASGSGKSSLVFGTIAAESQRLINETYSAFVQGFMPAPATTAAGSSLRAPPQTWSPPAPPSPASTSRPTSAAEPGVLASVAGVQRGEGSLCLRRWSDPVFAARSSTR